MSFGATVREILTASCGCDLRSASAATAVPLDSPGTTRTLAANLELAFGIAIPAPDLAHLRTVRDVLQCVRLRLWEKQAWPAAEPATLPAASRLRPVFVRRSSDPYERFLRYTAPAALADSAATTRPRRG
jgi:hypothetical protein